MDLPPANPSSTSLVTKWFSSLLRRFPNVPSAERRANFRSSVGGGDELAFVAILEQFYRRRARVQRLYALLLLGGCFGCGAALPSSLLSRLWGDSPECPPATVLRQSASEQQREEWCEKTDGTLHGPRRTYDVASGQLRLWVEYRDGLEDGLTQGWYPEGTTSFRGFMRSGKLEGEWIEWYPNGQRAAQIDFADDQLSGPALWWYPNGEKKMQGQHVADQHDGLWTMWFENGTKRNEYTWKRGVLDGPCRVWYRGGRLRFEGMHRDDKQHGEWHFWKEDGTLARTVYYD